MKKKTKPETPPPPPETPPALSLVVEVKRESVYNVIMPEGCSVHVYDYNRCWKGDECEGDDEGVQCKQTIYLKSDKKRQTPYKFRLFIHSGVVKRVVLPHGGCEVLVKTYEKDGTPHKELKWVRKK